MREQCKKLSFWNPIFDRKDLILSYTVHTMKDWIKIYNISLIITPLIDYVKFSIGINDYDKLKNIFTLEFEGLI